MKFKPIEIFTFLTGLVIISFIIWNRFIRVRLPNHIGANGSIIQLLGIIVLCLLFFLLVLYSLHKFLHKGENKESWVNKAFFYISNKYYLSQIYTKVYMYPLIEYIGSYLSAKVKNYKKIFYLIVFVIPKMIISICFFIDVVIYKEFFYFYNALALLIIPLIVSVILFIIQDHANIQNKRILYFYIFERTETHLYISLQPYLSVEDREFAMNEDSEMLYRGHLNYIIIDTFVTQIKEIKNFYDYRVNIVYYGIYFVAFFFYVLILLNVY